MATKPLFEAKATLDGRAPLFSVVIMSALWFDGDFPAMHAGRSLYLSARPSYRGTGASWEA